MKREQHTSTLARYASVAMAVIVGSTIAFVVGARAGAQLDHRTRTVSVVPSPVNVSVAHR